MKLTRVRFRLEEFGVGAEGDVRHLREWPVRHLRQFVQPVDEHLDEFPVARSEQASFERELMANLGVRVLYVWKNVVNQTTTTNIARPRSAYNIPLTRRDPGPDDTLNTADDPGKSITIWDYDAAF